MSARRLLGCALISLLGLACAAAMPPGAQHDLLGKSVSFTLASSDGNVVTLPSRQASTVVDYFAPSCVPCRKKVPALVAERKRLEGAGAELVLVGVLADDESTELAQATLAEWGLPGERFLVDREDVSARVAGVRSLPMTQVFDASATLRWVAPDDASPNEVLEAVGGIQGGAP